MYKLKNNQKGFSIGQVLLVILVLGLIGAVGYYVYQRQNQSNITNFEECKAAGNPIMESYPEQCSADGQTFTNTAQQVSSETIVNDDTVKAGTENWKTYKGTSIALQYPEDWDVDTKPEGQTGITYITSPDFVAATDLGPSVTAGYLLEVIETKEPTYESHDDMVTKLGEAKDAGGCGGSFSVTKIDGKNAVISDLKCHGSYETAIIIDGDTEYMLRFNSLDEDSQASRQLLRQILSTVELP